ncbi:Hypothetical protein NTJ_12588 [Nesidiocoris tenuis]|uniref:Uncharacterized protein n=1 Tax=Nesidiocoris tenuis TaxID=355587 RepID=A0ABN7B5U2_9HEMI|nr:Hypothetical protein NTJ_12588 [Nesidiocoris tenuis]
MKGSSLIYKAKTQGTGGGVLLKRQKVEGISKGNNFSPIPLYLDHIYGQTFTCIMKSKQKVGGLEKVNRIRSLNKNCSFFKGLPQPDAKSSVQFKTEWL